MSFDAGTLEAAYGFVDELPASLVDKVVAHPVGELLERGRWAVTFCDALSRGQVPAPSAWSWPPPPHRDVLRETLDELDIARFCAGQPELVEALVGDLMDAVASTERALAVTLAGIRRQLLKRLEAERLEVLKSVGKRDASGRALRWKKAQAQVEQEALAETEGRLREQLRGRILKVWGPRVRLWSAISEVFGDLGTFLGLGWDLSQGVLRHQGWLEIKRLQQLLTQLPQLKELIRVLGRRELSEEGPSVLEQVLAGVRRAAEELRDVRTPGVPHETRGVERSGVLERMLPVEAALLGHPTLRLLWHARRAERALMTYRVEGVLTEKVQEEQEAQAQQLRDRTPHQRGPIIVCLDTSGSMHGLPELVAKALTLEAMRVAHQERRACYLYAFSGPGQVVEWELDLSPGGLGGLMRFLAGSFHGGTDVEEPLRRALARVELDGWERADLLLVSDGEFPTPPGIPEAVVQAREDSQARVHGVLVGGGDPVGSMRRLCDPLHHFVDWGALLL